MNVHEKSQNVVVALARGILSENQMNLSDPVALRSFFYGVLRIFYALIYLLAVGDRPENWEDARRKIGLLNQRLGSPPMADWSLHPADFEWGMALLSEVPWAERSSEEWGTIHEQLLERVPVIQAGRFAFEELKGRGRKGSGSFYTPPRLVAYLLDSALEPVIAETLAENQQNPVEALLKIAVVDPSCGTGHFLLAAARRLAEHVEAWGGKDARAEVVRRCIYGVDLDPLATELCQLLFLRESGSLPQIRHGNALLGATPALVAAGVPERAWDPVPGENRAVARRLKRRNGGPWQISGPEAADLWCAAFLWPKESGEESAPGPELWKEKGVIPPETERIARSLAQQYHFFHWNEAFPEVFARGGFDVVVGNPPYLNQLENQTAVVQGVRRLLDAKFGSVKQPYTDLATLFMVESHRILREGGRQALVHPLSFFAAQDAAPARKQLATFGTISHLWITTEHMFAASVFVGALTLQKNGPRKTKILRHSSNQFLEGPPIEVEMDQILDTETWGPLIAELIGVPALQFLPGPALSTLASTTADFRDQFYGLIPHVEEESPENQHFPPLVVTGLIEPGRCLWGEQGCRFGKQAWIRPRVNLDRLQAAGELNEWARSRLVPKLVVATQTRIIEAFADPTGNILNTVPTITVTPHRLTDLWKLLAVLLSPPVSAWALSRYAGTALSMDAIKLSAEQVGHIPLPSLETPWQHAAACVQAGDLSGAAAWMCDAYQLPREPVLSWWEKRYQKIRSLTMAPAASTPNSIQP